MSTLLDYPAQLALWRTVPLKVVAPTGRIIELRRCRKNWYIGITTIQQFKPGIKLTEQGKKCSYERKKHNLVAVGPALAIMLDRPELASLLGGDDLQGLRGCWEYEQNAQAIRQMKSVSEAQLGFRYETLTVRYDSSGDMTHFRIRAGQRVRGLAAIEKVLSPEEFSDIYEISFSQDENRSFCDLAADSQYWV